MDHSLPCGYFKIHILYLFRPLLSIWEDVSQCTRYIASRELISVWLLMEDLPLIMSKIQMIFMAAGLGYFELRGSSRKFAHWQKNRTLFCTVILQNEQPPLNNTHDAEKLLLGVHTSSFETDHTNIRVQCREALITIISLIPQSHLRVPKTIEDLRYLRSSI